MRWPDIFFKARKPPEESAPTPRIVQSPEASAPSPVETKPPSIKPVPAGLQPKVVTSTSRLKIPPTEAGAKTIPAAHGVVLRPPIHTGSANATNPATPTAAPAPAPMKSIEQLMEEADPVHTLRQTGSLRLLKTLPTDPEPPKPAETPASTPKPEPAALAPVSPGSAAPPAEVKKAEPGPVTPAPTPTPTPTAVSPEAKAPARPVAEEEESPFILTPAKAPPLRDARRTGPITTSLYTPAAPTLSPFGSIFRRKAKLTDVARIVLPPKREEPEPMPAAAESSATVVPPSFPVPIDTGRLGLAKPEISDAPKIIEPAAPEKPPEEKLVAAKLPAVEKVAEPFVDKVVEKPVEPAVIVEARAKDPATPPEATEKKVEDLVVVPEKKPGLITEKPAPEIKPEIPAEPVPVQIAESRQASPPSAPSVAAPVIEPRVDPEAHKPKPSVPPAPRPDPEAHKPKVEVGEAPVDALTTAPRPAEKREFHLANGERVVGNVLSETPEAYYIEHGTLGVVTVPRAQIAKRLIEIILINGDRIVGDVMAETADTLYVRHASLGMLTVPRAQRSTRVVEAILKDGDRILGEVLTETETATVIRSATLGTVTVPHAKLAMLNRKVEQLEMKALPAPAPELKDKPPESR